MTNPQMAPGGFMQDGWATIPSFPLYQAHPDGLIRSTKTETIMKTSLTREGRPKLNLMLDNLVFTRQVSHLIAETFLAPPQRSDFTGLINCNGDLTDCSANNLLWRPSYFVTRYQDQFEDPYFMTHRAGVEELKTGVVYEKIQRASIENGILLNDIIVAIHMKTYVWPTYQRFRLIPPLGIK